MVEANQTLAARYAEALAALHVSTQTATSREAAEIAIDKAKFDCVFLSIETHPDTGESESLVRSVRRSASNATVPIVMLCDTHTLLPLARACRAGASHFLCKPIVMDQLVALLEALRPTMQERKRAYQRSPMAFPVLCRHGDQEHVTTSVNLSASGMLMTRAHDLGDVRDLEVEFPFNCGVASPFILHASVARRCARDDTWAVQFGKNPSDEMSRLKLWVEMSLVALQEDPNSN